MNRITYTNEILNAYSGQYNGEAGIYVDGEIIGVAQYVLYNGELTISDIFIRPEFRRKGYGSRLIKYIKQENPEYKYIPSMKTEDGAKFIHKELPLEEGIKAKFVYESLAFERGKDPKKSLKLGSLDIEEMKKQYDNLQDLMGSGYGGKLQTKFASEVISLIPRDLINKTGWGNIHYYFGYLPRDILFDFKELIDKYTDLLGLKESINFERGMEPKEALGIGRTIWVRGDRGYGLYKARLLIPYEGPDIADDEEAWEIEILEGKSKGNKTYAIKNPDNVIEYDEESRNKIWGEIDPFVNNEIITDFANRNFT
jgi:GNAT superfamily N-acetyltransferase